MLVPPRPTASPWRSLLAAVSLVVGIAVTFTGVLLVDAAHGLFTAEGFANRVEQSLHDPRVAAYVADRITDGVLRESPDLTSFRPLVRAAAQSVVGSDAFGALARRAARSTHHTLFSERSRNVLLSVPDVDVLLRNTLEKASPELARRIPPRATAFIGSLYTSQAAKIVLETWRIGRQITWFGIVGLFVGPFLLVLAWMISPDRRREVLRIAVGLLLAAGMLLLARPLGRSIVAHVPADPALGQAVAGFWDATTRSWRVWTLLLGGTGLVLAAAAYSLLEEIELSELGGRVRAWLREPPGGPAGRLIRAALFLALGLFGMFAPGDAVGMFTVVAGAAVAFEGLRELFAFLLRHLPMHVPLPAGIEGPRRWPWWVAFVAAISLVLLLPLLFLGHRAMQEVVAPKDSCNGAPELCDRPLDQVVFPGTHNAMSSAEISTWMFPQQEKGVRAQIDEGIRALLLDVHYGRPVGDHVKTDVDAEQAAVAKYERAVGVEGMAAARRIRDRLVGKEEGPRGVYCAHGLCELGATPFELVLRDVHGFLVENPNEVLVLLLEDYVTPEDLARPFETSGLIDFVYRGAAARPWPTLRQMITEGQRVLVLAESGRPGVPWIHPAFQVLQETPALWPDPAQSSCGPGRGGTSGSLFLLNHWIDTTPTPKPSNAALVNAYAFLLQRCRTCERERGHLPNIVAVDFYRTGDLFRVCRTLNGLEGPPAIATTP